MQRVRNPRALRIDAPSMPPWRHMGSDTVKMAEASYTPVCRSLPCIRLEDSERGVFEEVRFHPW